MTFTIPPEIEDKYEGRWIAWDTDTNQLVADGETMEQVMDRAKDHADRTGHLIWYHNCLPKDAIIIGPW